MARSVLTDRQYDVLRLHAAGLSIQNIALALDISTSTVRTHLVRAQQVVRLQIERTEIS